MISSVFDSANFRANDRFAAAEAAARSWADLQPFDDNGDIRATWSMWQLGSLVVSETSHSPLRFDRGGPRFRRYDNDFLLVEMYDAGVGLGRAGESCFENRSGRISLIDMSQGFTNVTGQIKTQSLLIPHAAIAYDPSVRARVVNLATDEPHGRVLAHALRTLPGRMLGLADSEAEPLALEVAEVLQSLLLRPDGAEPHAVLRARRVAMQNHIEARLRQPDLGVDDLCAAFGLSRSALYRHFAETNGVAGYIRERRLRAASRALAASKPGRGLIREVSERYGFSDPGHFNRLFKQRFACTPGEAVASSSDNRNAPIDPVSLLDGWLSSLRAPHAS